MNSVSNTFVLMLCVMFWHNVTFSQLDSADVPDVSDTTDQNEQLFERSPQDEDSPIIDAITEEPFQWFMNPTITIRSRIVQRLQRPAGYERNAYLGSAIKSYQRMKFTAGEHIAGGILFEKDAGEQRMNDFTSGHIAFLNIGLVQKIVLGDYRVEAGQGLILWRGNDFSKGAVVTMPAKKNGHGIVPHASSDENAFFRGIAVDCEAENMNIILFYSKRFHTASVDTNQFITSLSTSGYFRTINEQNKRDNVIERVMGLRGIYHLSDKSTIGFTAYKTSFSNSLLVDDGRKYAGTGDTPIALDARIELRPVMLFGEWARANKTLGGLSGILLQPVKDIDFIALFRYYPYEFISLHGLGFGEGASTSNETGLYFGLQVKVNRWLKFRSYFDQYRFPRPVSSVVFSSGGNDFLIQTEFNGIPRSEITLRYQRKISEERTTITDPNGFVNSVNDRQRVQRVRLNIDCRLSPAVKLRSRIERIYFGTQLSKRNEKGLMIYHDVGIRHTEQLSWNTRLTFFQTDSYDSRIYELENDLKGVSSLPGLYGRGVRWYLLLRYRIADGFELSAKYLDLIRDDVKHIGTGLDELPANHDNRFSFQIDFSL